MLASSEVTCHVFCATVAGDLIRNLWGGREAVIKSAASAASPEGFSSRDQVSCKRSLPGGPKKRENINDKLPFLLFLHFVALLLQLS